jgi:hypothetical protein
MGDGHILRRVVLSIYPVAHIGACGQCLEAVQEAGWHIKVPKVGVIEQERLMPSEGRGVPTGVDQHIMNGAIRAADQLRFASTQAAVKTADDTLPRTGLGVLHEGGRPAGDADEGVKNIRVESPCEYAALVEKRLRGKDEDICEGGPFDAHLEMLA